MNPTVEKLILQITWLCLQITSQGKWHAFVSVPGHVRNIQVYVLPADTDYDGEYDHAIYQQVKYQPGRYDGPEDAPGIETAAIIDLQKLLAELEQFLDLAQLGRETLARAHAAAQQEVHP